MTKQEITDLQFDLDARENQRWNYEQEAEKVKIDMEIVFNFAAALKDVIKKKIEGK
jgi:hypothetical protein